MPAGFEEFNYHRLEGKSLTVQALAEAVEALYADAEQDPELTAAAQLVQRHYAAKLAAGRRDQVAAALARRGFSQAVIRQVLENAQE